MESQAKKPFLERAGAVLVILNVIVLGALWLLVIRKSHDGPPPPDRGGPREVDRFLIRELGLDADQAKAFDASRERFFKALRPFQEKVRSLKEEAMNEAFGRAPDAAKLEALTAAIGAARTEEEKLLYGHFQDMMSICREDQKVKFRSIMREFMIQIGAIQPVPPKDGAPPRGRPDGRRGGPPPDPIR